MKYRLMKLVEGVWYEWGTYTDPARLAQAAFFLGHCGGIDEIRVEVIDD